MSAPLPSPRPSATGLDDVVAADTLLSHVDGARGELVIAGARVEDLAGRAPFEAVVARLWEAAGLAVPAPDVADALSVARRRLAARLPEALPALALAEALPAVRAALPLLRPAPEDPAELLAAVTLATGAWIRLHGPAPLPLDALAAAFAADAAADAAAQRSPSLARDVLRLALGPLGADEDARTAGLDAYLSTVIDHGLNASTFTARVVASTASDALSAVVAALGALKGPLHGGAPGPVLDMLDAIGTPDRARAWIDAELAAGRRIMGMGHRIYRVRDPRAAVLEEAVRRLVAAGVASDRLRLAAAVEAEATAALAARHPDRPLPANVEFATAVLLDAVGLPREAFPAVFAVGRSAGWLAHVAEQRAGGRLIRPKSRYIGELPA